MHGRSHPCDYRPEQLLFYIACDHTHNKINYGKKGVFGSQIERVESIKTGKSRQRGGVVVCRLNMQGDEG